uniref:SUEL-type lectin domain-containing protein n=1 Tax=Anopheles dirus TaxID=7168 RepID=A0A182NLG3_9DIPT
LLSSTLRAFRTICCDDELLTLSCPIGTSISVELVQYGAKGTFPMGAHSARVGDFASTYSILQTVVEACQKKRRCRIQATPKNFATAPCPGIHRMVEVNHKCRPFEFRSLISCEKDIVRLTCGQYTRIAIYSATYGRTAYESSHCSQTAASKEQTCLSEHTSHTLTEICQGRRKCTVAVESSTFGNPCPENIRVYLKVIYACVSRNVFRARYITPLEEDELDERPYESNELYDEELTPAPNQIEGSAAVGKGAAGNHNKYATASGESAVKAENIVTFNKDVPAKRQRQRGLAGGRRALARFHHQLTLHVGVGGFTATDGTGASADYGSSLLDERHLVVVSVAVLCFCCLCVAFGALLAYRMKLFPASGNRCIKASESTDNSHSTPSTGYRASSEDFDLVECIPEPGTTLVEKATEFAEPRGSLSQISTTMFILPNYLMAGPHPGTLSNRRPKDVLGPSVADNLTITLADIPGASGRMEAPSPAQYYAQHLPQTHQQHHVPPFGGSCGQCVALGWQPPAGNPPPLYGGPLMALEHPGGPGKPSHPYHRNQSLKSSTGEPEGRTASGGGSEDASGREGKVVGGATPLSQSHPFLWLGLKIALM